MNAFQSRRWCMMMVVGALLLLLFLGASAALGAEAPADEWTATFSLTARVRRASELSPTKEALRAWVDGLVAEAAKNGFDITEPRVLDSKKTLMVSTIFDVVKPRDSKDLMRLYAECLKARLLPNVLIISVTINCAPPR